MNAEIITVGTELLLGDILDSNSQFLSRELAAYGIQLLYQSTVGDNNARLREVFRAALERSDLVILTGGLGPTPDDLTRETVCDVLGIPLVLHQESWVRIQEYFTTTGKEMSPNNQKQAFLPAGCTVFPNDYGTAPGCGVEQDGKIVILLPGPPREMIPMFNQSAAPYLSKFSGGTIFSRTVGVFGIPESTVAERLADLLSGSSPTVAPYAKEGEVTLRVTAKAADQAAAQAICDPVVEEIRQRLGSNVYAVDGGSLQKTVVTLLMEKGKKIATAESCTAGLLSGRITEIPGASSVFECGVAAYSGEIKHHILGVSQDLLEQYGAVSPQVAGAMAMGIRRVSGADLGIGITGVAGPETSEGKPVGTVYMALADDKRVWVKKIVAGHRDGERDYVRYIATSYALDLVRRYLEALPGVMAGGEPLPKEPDPTPEIPVTPKTGQQRRFLATIFPWKGDSVGQAIGKAAVWLAIVLVLALGFFLFYQYVWEPLSNQRLNDELVELYNPEGTVSADDTGKFYPKGMLTQFYGLYDRNPDIGGWIKIDDTNIHYPVMQNQADGYYRTHNFDRRVSSYGVPYFGTEVALTTPQSFNRVFTVYGNNTRNGQMFSDLLQYRELEFLRAHPTVEMNTIFTNQKWKIFAVMVVDETDTSFSYARTTFESEADFTAFIEEVRDRSLFDIPTEVQSEDSLLFLTTSADEEYDFDGAQIVIAARAVRTGEGAYADLSGASQNRDVQMPAAWKDRYQTPTAGGTTRRQTGSSDFAAVSTTAPLSSLTQDSGLSTTTADAGGSESDSSDEPVASERPSTGAGHTTTITSSQQSQKPTQTQTTSTTQTQPTVPTTPPSDGAPKAVWGSSSLKESDYLQNFRLKDPNGKIYAPQNKEELQEALTLVVAKEIGGKRAASSSTEAWKAQAVASYTYILWECQQNGADYAYPITLKNQSMWDEISSAISDVVGVKIVDSSSGAPIAAKYFASSPGVTATSPYVSSYPYLKSVESTYDYKSAIIDATGNELVAESQATISVQDFTAQVQTWGSKKAGKAVTVGFDEKAGKPLIYAVTEDGGAGKYVNQTNVYYTVDGKKTYVTGKQLREEILTMDGGEKLRSHCFFVDQAGDILTFHVFGYGHGQGLSQTGAIGYANKGGWMYDSILTHYYSLSGQTKYVLVKPTW